MPFCRYVLRLVSRFIKGIKKFSLLPHIHLILYFRLSLHGISYNFYLSRHLCCCFIFISAFWHSSHSQHLFPRYIYIYIYNSCVELKIVRSCHFLNTRPLKYFVNSRSCLLFYLLIFLRYTFTRKSIYFSTFLFFCARRFIGTNCSVII